MKGKKVKLVKEELLGVVVDEQPGWIQVKWEEGHKSKLSGRVLWAPTTMIPDSITIEKQ